METVRATQLWQRAGACYVRIQAMAKKHGIALHQEFDEHDGADARCVVVLDEGFPVATARMYPLDEMSVMIGRVVVLPEYRGRGLGAQVVRACEQWAAEEGCTTSVVESREGKEAFYQRLGYAPCGAPPVEGEIFRCTRMEKLL